MENNLSQAERPRISLICPTRNVAKYIEQMMKTIIAQSYKNWELLIMDAASTDGTVDIVKKYAVSDSRIRIVSEPDEGPWHALEKALVIARGEFLSLYGGQDGILDKDWLKKCMAVLDADKSVALVWGFMATAREDGTLLGAEHPAVNAAIGHFLKQETFFERLRFLVRKIFKIISDLLFADMTRKKLLLKKIFSRTAGMRASFLVSRRFPGGKVPQKEDWFSYWLDTGFVFPDQSMLMNKRIYLECEPRYPMGSHSEHHLTQFNYNFMTRGYLAYCIPEFATFVRSHPGNSPERILEALHDDYDMYLRKVAAFRKKILGNHEEVVFRDRYGNPVSRRKF